MTRPKRTPRPVYRKPEPIENPTPDDFHRWAERHNAWFRKSPEVKLAETLGEVREKLRAAIRAVGGVFRTECDPASWPDATPGYGWSNTGDDVVCYRTKDLPPEVPEAIKALLEAHELQQTEGEARVLAAFNLGRRVQRFNVELVLAKPIDSYLRTLRKSVLTDDDIRGAIAATRTLAEASERLGISERQLRSRKSRLGIRKRKSARLPPPK